MRILYSHRIQSHDGQAVHLEEMVAALRAEGHEVLVVGPGFYEQSGFGGESRMVARLRGLLPGAAGELAELAYNIPAYRRLARAAARFRPDLVYERYNLFFLAGSLLARRHKHLFYLEVNAPIAEERAKFGTLRLQRIARWSERLAWRTARRVLAVTEVLGGMVAATGVPPERICITQNGIDVTRFPATPAVAGETITLGFVGFMRVWHGLADVIDAMAADPDPRFRLTIVGEGPARLDLEEQTRRLGLAGRVSFLGLASPEEIPALVSRFDIALQPKVVAYASPLKIFEYMAAARAIVAPDQPNIREILIDGQTAVLFEPSRPDDLWSAVQRLAADAALRERLGKTARTELLARDYTWKGNANRITTWAAQDTIDGVWGNAPTGRGQSPPLTPPSLPPSPP